MAVPCLSLTFQSSSTLFFFSICPGGSGGVNSGQWEVYRTVGSMLVKKGFVNPLPQSTINHPVVCDRLKCSTLGFPLETKINPTHRI